MHLLLISWIKLPNKLNSLNSSLNSTSPSSHTSYFHLGLSCTTDPQRHPDIDRMGLNLLAAAIVAFLAFLFVGRQDVFIIPPETYTHVPESIEDPNRAIRTFSTALTYPTVGNAHSKNHVSNPAPFEDLLRHLHTSFPLVYNTLTVETVNQYSLLMTWPGTDVSLRPLLLVSHIDVVPAEDPENKWTHPPFSGAVDDEGFIWGRGAMDSKVSAVGILEAISQLIASGVPQPRRTVLIAIGHDEELTGTYGAREIASECVIIMMHAYLLFEY